MNDVEVRDFLLKHSKSKLNGIFPEAATHRAEMLNPLCGDHVEIRLVYVGDRIEKVGFATKACAICSATASLLSENVVGWSLPDFESRKEEFEKSLTTSLNQAWPQTLMDFTSLIHLRVNPRRRACAILPWLTLQKALRQVSAC